MKINIAAPKPKAPGAPGFLASKPRPPKVNIPQTLPKIEAAKASEVVAGYKPSTEALRALKPGMSPPEYLGSLQEKNLSPDSIQFLTHGMPDRESTFYACKSCRLVEDKLDPADLEALKSAEAWVSDPNPDTRTAATKAAESAGFQGPGAWSAQAASLAGRPPTPGVPAATPHAAAGAVQLAAAKSAGVEIPKVPEAMPKEITIPADQLKVPEAPVPEMPAMPEVPTEISPLEQASIAEVQNPFVQLGVDIASGTILPA